MRRVLMLDRSALIITLILALLGIVLVHSASSSGLGSLYWIKQCIWLCGGLAIYLLFSIYDYKKLISHANLIYAVGIVALVLVLRTDPINGARSWFRLPFMSIQPSEFVKIATVLVVAKYFSKFHERRSSLLGIRDLNGPDRHSPYVDRPATGLGYGPGLPAVFRDPQLPDRQQREYLGHRRWNADGPGVDPRCTL